MNTLINSVGIQGAFTALINLQGYGSRDSSEDRVNFRNSVMQSKVILRNSSGEELSNNPKAKVDFKAEDIKATLAKASKLGQKDFKTEKLLDGLFIHLDKVFTLFNSIKDELNETETQAFGDLKVSIGNFLNEIKQAFSADTEMQANLETVANRWQIDLHSSSADQ